MTLNLVIPACFDVIGGIPSRLQEAFVWAATPQGAIYWHARFIGKAPISDEDRHWIARQVLADPTCGGWKNIFLAVNEARATLIELCHGGMPLSDARETILAAIDKRMEAEYAQPH